MRRCLSQPSDPDLYAEKKAQAEMKLKMQKIKDRDGSAPPVKEPKNEIPLRKGDLKRATPPGKSSHIWQRVAFESCKHLAYGEKCGEFTTKHTDDFEEFKGARAATRSASPVAAAASSAHALGRRPVALSARSPHRVEGRQAPVWLASGVLRTCCRGVRFAPGVQASHVSAGTPPCHVGQEGVQWNWVRARGLPQMPVHLQRRYLDGCDHLPFLGS